LWNSSTGRPGIRAPAGQTFAPWVRALLGELPRPRLEDALQVGRQAHSLETFPSFRSGGARPLAERASQTEPRVPAACSPPLVRG
jgi:hypothetical protein